MQEVFNVTSLLFLLLITTGEAIRCFQCSSGQDAEGEDTCGAYKKFDKTRHIAVDCNSEESHMPGSFCMKVTQQGPMGFVWDARWRQVIRRCASVAELGVTGVCNWGVYENGDYWEECYCIEDECNSSTRIGSNLILTFTLLLLSYLILH
ncbi:hypothetical protein RI129_010446 [Pyrocoelia pectoralis]|uniref:Protein sleepless n=1 Tax=Pyrocoelia pectoralis TaxID=417401 RepID=A0AAN7VEH9_9COLE